MNDNVLVVGTGSLQGQLVDAFIERNAAVVSTYFSESSPQTGGKTGKKPKKPPETASKGENHHAVAWNPSSSLTSKNILLQAERTGGQITKAFLVYPSGKTTEAFHETTTAAIQKILDYRVRAYLFFLKDLINYFMEKKTGELYGVLHFEEGELSSPLIAGSYGMFREVIASCLPLYEKEAFSFMGFESESPDVMGYANFILKQDLGNRKRNGSFLQFPSKGLFSSGSSRKK